MISREELSNIIAVIFKTDDQEAGMFIDVLEDIGQRSGDDELLVKALRLACEVELERFGEISVDRAERMFLTLSALPKSIREYMADVVIGKKKLKKQNRSRIKGIDLVMIKKLFPKMKRAYANENKVSNTQAALEAKKQLADLFNVSEGVIDKIIYPRKGDSKK